MFYTNHADFFNRIFIFVAKVETQTKDNKLLTQ
jgi:hypothetical protein